MDKWEQEERIKESNTQYFDTDFGFLKTHKGWRPGKIHLALAPTHHGKSTLIRSIVWDYVTHSELFDRPILVWLSEESSDDFKTEMAKIGLPQEILNRVHVASEQDEEFRKESRNLLLGEAIRLSDPALILFDNITTSCFYLGRTIEEQDNFANGLKGRAKKNNIPFILIAHTGGESQLSKRMLEANDIRGSKSVVNLAEFTYILQTFPIYDEAEKRTYKFPTIRIVKHRGYDVGQIFWKLKFNRETMSFMEDRPIDWNEFKSIFKQQQIL